MTGSSDPDSLPEHVRALLRGEAFEHPVQEVELVETHVSYVILAGNYAYKLRKHVDLGFLDFTSLEARKRDCLEEVRLNSRTCPALYLGVLAVSHDGGRYRLGGPGEVIDYAVQMRRLPQERMLGNLLDRGEVSVDMLGRLAWRIVRFHAEAEGGPRVRRIGGYDTMTGNWVQNLREVLPMVGDTLTPETFDRIRDFAETTLERERQLILKREDEGRVRDGHGDLRADAISIDSLSPDGICIFDCLEFSEALRCSDTGLDVAFLAMDLERRGHQWASDVFLSLYTAAAADSTFPLLSRLFRSYRAVIRGKVATIRAGQPGLTEAEREASRSEARLHFELAASYARPNLRPALIVVMGLSGSGKSMLAGALAHRAGAALLSTDIVRKSMAGMRPGRRRPEPIGSGIYAPGMTAKVYEEMAARAGAFLRDGRAVVLDGTYLDQAMRAPVLGLAARAAVPLLIVECRAPEDVIRQRQEGRSSQPWSASDASFEVYLDQKSRFEPPDEAPAEARLPVDTSLPLQEQLEAVLARLA